MITFVATVFLGRFSKDFLTALIPSELGILLCKDLIRPGILNMSYELSIEYFYFVDFS